MRSAKERYDEEMAMINGAKAEATANKAVEIDEDEGDLDETEAQPSQKPVDIRERASRQSAEQAALASLERFNRHRKASHLNGHDTARLSALLRRFEAQAIEHPLLRHLVDQKVNLTKRHLEAAAKARDTYQELLRQVAKSSDDALKLAGAIEHVDQQLLLLDAEHPEWRSGDGKPPPAA